MKDFLLYSLVLLFLLGVDFIDLSAQQNPLSAFQPLIGKTWKAEGNWGNGTQFKQEVTFSFDLNKSVVVAKSKGFINQEQSQYGDRNLGIRQYDPASKEIKFWEYDVFGGLTEGTVELKDQSFYYHYEYGGTNLTDAWEFINDSTFHFKVGLKEGESWKTVYLETQFIWLRPNKKVDEVPDLQKLLLGSWESKAWDGHLSESWSVGKDGYLFQNSKYVENGEVTYAAQSKIEIVGDEVILFSLIEDDMPKIFKATSYSEKHITFENSDYPNPNKVHYEFPKEEGKYNRTISGMEGGKSTSYTFNFSKIKD